MVMKCQHWRQSVSGIGIDELYNRMDPFDVSNKCFEILVTFDAYYWSFPAVRKYSNRGQCTSTRYIRRFTTNVLGLFPCLCQTDKVSRTSNR